MSNTSKVAVSIINHLTGLTEIEKYVDVTGVYVGESGQLVLEFADDSTRAWARGYWAGFFDEPEA